jgi:hypothetical protein
MKKCPSELELEAFIRCQGAAAAAEQKPGHAAHGADGPFGVFTAADLAGFGFGDSVSSLVLIDRSLDSCYVSSSDAAYVHAVVQNYSYLIAQKGCVGVINFSLI